MARTAILLFPIAGAGDLKIARYDGQDWAIETVDGGDISDGTPLGQNVSGDLAIAYLATGQTTVNLALLRAPRPSGSEVHRHPAGDRPGS